MGKSSRHKQIRREIEQDVKRIQEVRLKSRALMEAAKFEMMLPRPMVAQVELLAVGAYEEAIGKGIEILGTGVTAERLADYSDACGKIFDFYCERAYSLFEAGTNATPDCKVGCNWCCHLRVTIKAHEALGVSRALNALDPDVFVGVVERAKVHVATTDSMQPMTILRSTRLCPLNVEGNCLIYKNRPLTCRNAHSYSVKSCRTYVESGQILPNRTSAFVNEISRFVTTAESQICAFYGLDGRACELVDLLVGFETDKKLADAIAKKPNALDKLYRAEVEAAAEQDMLQLMSQE